MQLNGIEQNLVVMKLGNGFSTRRNPRNIFIKISERPNRNNGGIGPFGFFGVIRNGISQLRANNSLRQWLSSEIVPSQFPIVPLFLIFFKFIRFELRLDRKNDEAN